MGSHKTLKIKKVLAKKQKQNSVLQEHWQIAYRLHGASHHSAIEILYPSFAIDDPTNPSVDSYANWQYDPLQRQEAPLEKNEAQALNDSKPVAVRDSRLQSSMGSVSQNFSSYGRFSSNC